MPAPKCNQHAAKSSVLRKSRTLSLRVTSAERDVIDRVAREQGLRPTVWVRETLVAEASRLTAGLR